MKFFGRKKERLSSDQMANKIASFIGKVQQSFANCMTRATKNLSSRSLKWTLILFLIFGTAFSIYVASIALSAKQSSIKINHLHAPIYFQDDQQDSAQIISKLEYEQLLSVDKYLDSLHKSKSKLYDTIMKVRPGLLDSVKLLESFYNNQNK